MSNIVIQIKDDKKLHMNEYPIPAFREEQCTIQLLNISPSVATNLTFTLLYNGSKVAECAAFSTTDGVTTGTLNLNTEELEDVMANYHKRKQKKFQVTLWDDYLDKLLINDNINVMSNPYDASLPAPTPIT